MNLGIVNYDLKRVLCMDDTYSVRDNISMVTGGSLFCTSEERANQSIGIKRFEKMYYLRCFRGPGV